MVDVQMGVELDDNDVLPLGQFVVEGQHAQVIAGRPQEKIATLPDFVDRGPGVAAPALVSVDRVESEFLEAHLRGKRAGTGRLLLTLGVGKQLLECIREQESAVARAAVAEKVERKEERGSFHAETPECSRAQASHYERLE